MAFIATAVPILSSNMAPSILAPICTQVEPFHSKALVCPASKSTSSLNGAPTTNLFPEAFKSTA